MKKAEIGVKLLNCLLVLQARPRMGTADLLSLCWARTALCARTIREEKESSACRSGRTALQTTTRAVWTGEREHKRRTRSGLRQHSSRLVLPLGRPKRSRRDRRGRRIPLAYALTGAIWYGIYAE